MSYPPPTSATWLITDAGAYATQDRDVKITFRDGQVVIECANDSLTLHADTDGLKAAQAILAAVKLGISE